MTFMTGLRLRILIRIGGGTGISIEIMTDSRRPSKLNIQRNIDVKETGTGDLYQSKELIR